MRYEKRYMTMLNLYKNIKKRRLELELTQSDLAQKLGYSDKSMIAKIEKGSIDLPQSKISAFAKALNTSEIELMGYVEGVDYPAAARTPEDYGLTRLSDVHKKAIPMLGTVACGTPIYANEEHDSYVLADEDIDADYCLTAKGDSMINARIYDGDLIFVKQCDHVENGEIAVVAIGDEVTLKRVYFYPENHTHATVPSMGMAFLCTSERRVSP